MRASLNESLQENLVIERLVFGRREPCRELPEGSERSPNDHHRVSKHRTGDKSQKNMN